MSWLKTRIISSDLDCCLPAAVELAKSNSGDSERALRWTCAAFCKISPTTIPTRAALTARRSRRAHGFLPWLAPEWIKPNQIPTELPPPPPGERHSLTFTTAAVLAAPFGMWSCHWQSDEQCKKTKKKRQKKRKKQDFSFVCQFFFPCSASTCCKILQKCTHPSTSNSK